MLLLKLTLKHDLKPYTSKQLSDSVGRNLGAVGRSVSYVDYFK